MEDIWKNIPSIYAPHVQSVVTFLIYSYSKVCTLMAHLHLWLGKGEGYKNRQLTCFATLFIKLHWERDRDV